MVDFFYPVQEQAQVSGHGSAVGPVEGRCGLFHYQEILTLIEGQTLSSVTTIIRH